MAALKSSALPVYYLSLAIHEGSRTWATGICMDALWLKVRLHVAFWLFGLKLTGLGLALLSREECRMLAYRMRRNPPPR